MKKKKENYLLDAVTRIFSDLKRGRALDLGCGDGDYAKRLKELGFDVVACDIDKERFKYRDEIEFKAHDITQDMPFRDNEFDYVLLMEVTEHLKNPYTVFQEVNRVIKKDAFLILSMPNILSLKSRFRFLFEGAYDYFREPPLDQINNPKEKIFNLHIVPYRYHELEYLLLVSGFKVENIFTSLYTGYSLWFLLPFLKLQAWQKERRSLKKGSIDYKRINRILFSKELLFGRHLVIQAKKIKQAAANDAGMVELADTYV